MIDFNKDDGYDDEDDDDGLNEDHGYYCNKTGSHIDENVDNEEPIDPRIQVNKLNHNLHLKGS
jgi:hypothetical protein